MNDIDMAENELDALDRAETTEQGGNRQVWERQAGESAKAYAAFAKYRDLSSARTMAKVAEMSECSAQNIHRWARRWFWTQRCYEYDLIEEQRFREQASRDRLNHHRRQVRVGQALQSIAIAGIRELQARLEQKLPLGLDPVQIAALLKLGDQMESAGLGEDREGASNYTRIVVNLGTAEQTPDEPAPDLPRQSIPALCDDATGEGTFDKEPN
jgi:hypothetical protein